MVQWLGIGIFTAVVQVQFLIRGTKIQQAVCCDQKKGQYSLYHTWHNLWFIYEIGKNFKKNLEHNTPWQRVERIEQLNNSLLSNHVVKHCLSCKIGVMVNWMYKSNFKNWIIKVSIKYLDVILLFLKSVSTSSSFTTQETSGDWLIFWLFPHLYVLGGSAGKESTCNGGDLGSVPDLGRSPGEGNGYLLQYSGLESYMDCIFHGVAKSWTQLSGFHFHIFMSFSGLTSSTWKDYLC